MALDRDGQDEEAEKRYRTAAALDDGWAGLALQELAHLLQARDSLRGGAGGSRQVETSRSFLENSPRSVRNTLSNPA